MQTKTYKNAYRSYQIQYQVNGQQISHLFSLHSQLDIINILSRWISNPNETGGKFLQ
jgi:hypothetical protein